MHRRDFLRRAATAVPVFAALAGRPRRGAAQELAGMALPKPQIQGGRPLMQALSDRKTIRNISQEKLSPQMLSNLLWAAWGVNRAANNGRTAPSAMNAQEVSLYVFLEQGVYLFDEKSHSLRPVVAGDHRVKAGIQTGVATAPVNLVYVADLDKYGAGLPVESKTAWSNAHAGFIGQNVYLFAASEGLASCFRAFEDGPIVAQLLNLRPGQKVLYGQTVGYPAKG
jgi:nitroreductase